MPVTTHEVCQYDNSLDGHFIMDWLPEQSHVLCMSGSSGHGFKMGPALGELAAKAVVRGARLPATFRLSRFAGGEMRGSQFLPDQGRIT